MSLPEWNFRNLVTAKLIFFTEATKNILETKGQDKMGEGGRCWDKVFSCSCHY
jgi:hypothetical protein